MSLVDINDQWRVRSDRYNWTLESLHIPKSKDGEDGEPKWVTEGHHPSLQSALDWFVELSARQSDAVGLEALSGVVDMTLQDSIAALKRYQLMQVAPA